MYEEILRDSRELLVKAAKRYARVCRLDNAVDTDDLMQAGFIGLVAASETFDQGKGDWPAWAYLHIRRSMREALGIHSTRVKAHFGALSLDAPLSDDDELTGIDTLEDTSLPPIDADVERDDTRRVIRECVAEMKDDRQREVVQRWGLDGETQAAVAESLNISAQRVGQLWHDARRVLARDKRLMHLYDIELRTQYYHHVGVRRFNTTRTSATERAALWRIDHEQTPTPLPD